MKKQRTILCYGDSNTWGYVPLADRNQFPQRFSRHQRWTGKLQYLLGESYFVVEEGLNGRTTNLDYAIPPDRNGKTYLPPCLYTHAPIDLVILALGGNDFKTCFNRDPADICAGLSELINIIQASTYGDLKQSAPEILILSSPIPSAGIEHYVDEKGDAIFKGSIDKAVKLVGEYADLANKKNCYFLDISKTVIPSSVDGVHYDAEAHKQLADILKEKILHIFKNEL